MTKAPWTAEQIKNLTERQNMGAMHPYTCGPCSDRGDCTDLVATRAGWFCPKCERVVQDWAHDNDANGQTVKLFDRI